jgi:hypothetical protein
MCIAYVSRIAADFVAVAEWREIIKKQENHRQKKIKQSEK